jgi:hypothetical protein
VLDGFILVCFFVAFVLLILCVPAILKIRVGVFAAYGRCSDGMAEKAGRISICPARFAKIQAQAPRNLWFS